MSVTMDIYMKLHEARCEQIKGNFSSAMSLYNHVLQMIQNVEATSQPQEQKALNSFLEMVNEEIRLVQRSMETSNTQPSSEAQETACPPSIFPQVPVPVGGTTYPNTQPYTPASYDAGTATNETIAKEILDDEDSTHPPFREQVKNDWEYIKKYSAIGAGYCAVGFEKCVEGCKKAAVVGSEYCSVGYEKCKEGCKKVSESPRVQEFASTSKKAGNAFIHGIVDSFSLFIKAWKALFTNDLSSDEQEKTEPVMNMNTSGEVSETTSTPVSVFPSLPLENSVQVPQA